MKKHLIGTFILIGALVQAQSSCQMALNVTPGQYLMGVVNGSAAAPICTGGQNANQALWYKYTPTQNYQITITTNLLPVNQGKDSRLHVYTGSCGSLTCVGGNDDISGSNFLSEFTFAALANTTYYIAFDNRYGNNANNVTFQLIQNAPTPPPAGATFSTVNLPAINGSFKNCVVDMNGDYRDDIVSVSNGNIRQLIQFPGQFDVIDYPVASTSFMPSWSIAAGDLTKSGFNSLVYGSGQGVAVMRAAQNGSSYALVQSNQYVFSQRGNFVDINGDGHLDIFMCHDVQPNVYYINDGNGNLTFFQGGLGDFPTGGNYGSIWFDYDNDGDVDLFVAKCGGGPDRSSNTLHRNNGNGTFTDVSVASGLADPVQTWSAAVGDFNHDGWMDILVGASSFSNGGHKLMRNNGNGTFTDITAGSGWDTNTTTSIEFVTYDFDNDGHLDIIGGGSKILYGNGDFTFTSRPTNISNASFGDLNNDGFIDVQANSTIFYNNGNQNKWSKVTLRGIQSNRNGIGARVEIHGPWGIKIRDVQSGVGFRYMNSLNVHFGLGQSQTISKIVVKWPSGIVDQILNPAINTVINVVEASTLNNEAFSSEQFVLYPNPAADVLNIQTKFELKNYEIFDISGKLIDSNTFNNNQVNISSLSNGSYFIVINTTENTRKTLKFIKK
jgi:hypothetical protein